MVDKLTIVATPQRANKPVITCYCPSDKSITHRAILLAAAACGESLIYNPLLGDDCMATVRAVRSLGVRVDVLLDEHALRIKSPGFDGWKAGKWGINCGNSGTTARLLLGLLAPKAGIQVTLSGDDSLRRRPMARVCMPLSTMGAAYSGNYERLPITCLGRPLTPQIIDLPVASAQLKSAIILAALGAKGRTVVSLPNGARNHTEKMLEQLGAPIQTTIDSNVEHISIAGPWSPPPANWDIPGDPSSAAFLCVMALLRGESIQIPRILWNERRLGFFKALQKMGVCVDLNPPERQHHDGILGYSEPVFTLRTSVPRGFTSIEIGSDAVPTLIDEVPLLAVVMARAQGQSRISGLAELRFKESDRFAKTIELVRLAGGEIQVEGDTLLIRGGNKSIQGFDFDAVGDHRLVMTSASLACIAEGVIRIRGAGTESVSFPSFWEAVSPFVRKLHL